MPDQSASTPGAERPYEVARSAALCVDCRRGPHAHDERGCPGLALFWQAPPTWTDCTCKGSPESAGNATSGGSDG